MAGAPSPRAAFSSGRGGQTAESRLWVKPVTGGGPAGVGGQSWQHRRLCRCRARARLSTRPTASRRPRFSPLRRHRVYGLRGVALPAPPGQRPCAGQISRSGIAGAGLTGDGPSRSPMAACNWAKKSASSQAVRLSAVALSPRPHQHHGVAAGQQRQRAIHGKALKGHAPGCGRVTSTRQSRRLLVVMFVAAHAGQAGGQRAAFGQRHQPGGRRVWPSG